MDKNLSLTALPEADPHGNRDKFLHLYRSVTNTNGQFLQDFPSPVFSPPGRGWGEMDPQE
jgi:hypothetical protein